MPNFTESKLENLFSQLFEEKGYKHYLGSSLDRQKDEVILKDDLEKYLTSKYNDLTQNELQNITALLLSLSSTTLYESNKKFFKLLSDGYLLKREQKGKKDILIEFLDEKFNIYKFVTQLEVEENTLRIPDGVLYINGLPLVVFEFKSAIKEEVTIYDAYLQLTNRYKRDIPKLFVYNAFCVISDGANSKIGSIFSPYEFFYGWHRVESKRDENNTIYTLIDGLFEQKRLLGVIKNFIYFPDTSKKEVKIVCRYPQYYAVEALIKSIKKALKPKGDGKGGTYFGATGSGKSYTMLYLTRVLMRDRELENPTIILITDRVDLDDQLSSTFTNAKEFIGEDDIKSVGSRDELRELLSGKKSGGVYLTTIQKFSEDFKLLSDRANIICISDEAHRSQVNLDMKVRVSQDEVKKSYGFAKYLHDSLPNAVYVGFSGTPIDATIDVFGEIVDSYTMNEAVFDEITVRIVYEGRAAKVLLDSNKLQEIEEYYKELEELGANEYQIEKSKRVMATMATILGDSDRLKAVAKDFIEHYEKRVSEGASSGKAMFVCANREIAYKFYKEVIALRPNWAVKKAKNKKQRAFEYIKLIMTRSKDDEKELYEMLGNKEDRKVNERAFKDDESNFKIAIVVDMWLTGFDVPSLDTIYIDKPIQKHSLIQTISRVNRKYKGKEKGLVVDYIGIKRELNQALSLYNQLETTSIEDIQSSVVVVKNHLELLEKFFYKFDSSGYFGNSSKKQFETLQKAVEFVQKTKEDEKRFVALTKRLKSAYDICVGSEELSEFEREQIHFYIAIRSYLLKLTKPNVPDITNINQKVAQMIDDAIKSSGVEEIFTLSEDKEIDLFDENYLKKLSQIKLPNTKIKLLQKLLSRAIDSIKKVNRVKGIEFSQKLQKLVEVYNERSEQDILKSEVYEDIAEQLTQMIVDIQKEFNSGEELGIDFEEKAFYDILKSLCIKYDFSYPEDKLINLAKAVKELVESQAKFPDWDKREDIKASLKVELILLLDEHDYPPVERDEVYSEIFEQAESFKKGIGKYSINNSNYYEDNLMVADNPLKYGKDDEKDN